MSDLVTQSSMRMEINISFNPVGTLHINEKALLYVLSRILENEINENEFLQSCGITLSYVDRLALSFSPVDHLIIKETAVTYILLRLLQYKIDKNPFLKDCGIKFQAKQLSV